MDQPTQIGSVKTNIGHLESAAGVAGLIKVILQLQHQQLAPHLHLHQPTPHVDWQQLQLAVPTQLTPWDVPERRIAGVSAFGASGTNAHVVVEEAPAQPSTATDHPSPDRPVHLLTLSAKTEAALHDLVGRYATHLDTHPDQALADISYTTHTGRAHFEQRLAVVGTDATEVAAQLTRFGAGQSVTGLFTGGLPSGSPPPKLAFLFTGQGSQYVHMGRQLYETQPLFRQTLEDCADILQPYLDTPLLEVLYPDQSPNPSSQALLHQTAYTQPALFALEYALTQLWQSWGIRPDVVLGHSVGEYVAACVAGVFSLEDGLTLIAQRGRLMQALPPGGEMVAVLAPEGQVQEVVALYADQVAIAALNGPQSIVIAGAREAIGAICRTLDAQSVRAYPLHVSHAFHSPLMDPMLAEFAAMVAQVTYHPPQMPLISNLTGQRVEEAMTAPGYWVQHIRQPVRFAESMQTLAQQEASVFVEVGPKPTLLGLGRQCLPDQPARWLPSLRPGYDDWQQLLHSLGQLYVHGAAVDWAGLDQDYLRHKIPLPTYPFHRQRYWIDSAPRTPPLPIPSSGKEIHPLLTQTGQSPLVRDILFEAEISTAQLPFLADHTVYNEIVVPGGFHVALALEAAGLAFPSATCMLAEVSFEEALMLTHGESRHLQVVLTPRDETTVAFTIISLDPHEGEQSIGWHTHACGRVIRSKNLLRSDSAPVAPLSDDTAHLRYPTQFNQEGFYGQLRALSHMVHGPCFQWIRSAWTNPTESLCQLTAPPALTDTQHYQLHPTLVDALFQASACPLLEQAGSGTGNEGQSTFVPFRIKEFRVYQKPEQGPVWCHTALRQVQTSGMLTDIALFDHTGQCVAEVSGFETRKALPHTLLRTRHASKQDLEYELRWRATSPPLGTAVEPGRWLVFITQTGADIQLVAQLRQQGHTCVIVSPAEHYRKVGTDSYQVCPTQPADFQHLWKACQTTDQPLSGIVHAWNLSTTSDEMQRAQELGCGSVLHLIQALGQTPDIPAPPLWLVTQRAQRVDPTDPAVQVQQAPVWGLGRVIATEYPDLACRCVDLDSAADRPHALQAITQELLNADGENQIAYRYGQRHVARLERRWQDPLVVPTGQSWQVQLSAEGSLDHLTLQPGHRQPLGPYEVEIAVKAVGLNLRDVLTTLGLVQAPLGITQATAAPLGGECAGTVMAIGSQVQHLQVGQDVLAALAFGSFASSVTCPAERVVPKPASLSFAQAATLPIACLTAVYGLEQVAKLQTGERVLIHAAAGGVGQAAIQVAQRAGAEIFATAHPSKWGLLKAQGIPHVFSSRTTDFAAEIQRLTDGRGVEVVLNSLAGEFIPKSLDVLGQGGRFVEIGKRDIWSPVQVAQKRPDVVYTVFDVVEMTETTPQVLAQAWHQVARYVEAGQLRPLPYQTYPIEQVVEAFRTMQAAKHIGKIVVTLPDSVATAQAVSIRADASYLITGGLGALGLQVAQWLVDQGARHLILTSRHAPSAAAQAVLAQLEQAGATVAVKGGDVSHKGEVAAILAEIDTSNLPLRGVIHAAGIVDDCVLQQLTWERFTAVLAPKVQGAWNLHQCTVGHPLDFFVCFSSIASLLGSPGQGNYVAANAFLDALAQHRRALGLPGLSINWGPWAGSGMAAQLDPQHRERLERTGLRAIQPTRGLQVFGEMLGRADAQVAVAVMDWEQFLAQLPTGPPPLLKALTVTARLQPATADFLQELATVPPKERTARLIEYVGAQIAHVVGLSSPAQLGARQSLFDLGVDSLMAVEVRNRLQAGLGQPIPSTVLFDYPTLEALAEYLAKRVLSGAETREEEKERPEPEQSTKTKEELAQLSQDEMAGLLAEKLAEIR